MTTKVNERFIINELINMYTQGYNNDELDNFIDTHFDYGDDGLFYHNTGAKILNPLLKDIVELSFSMYDSKEMDVLLCKLTVNI